ncbi:hypothetical protein CUS40_05810 [Enterococcus faecium]|uniref:DUF1642 domain-containing protein n=1 Tax=Enterococcus faecium TaxID=1352 RepID=UPI000CF359E2|nr:DUF1642 domain-containing protein [Enterococcus faecium]EME8089043.1 DUF1642 domain-containing protein [Enterococcus faecium]EME8091414.1 DUF1642 domain-containing protein [Enterococcus faecium]EME8243122.1 DUF1642 domain-containing protein [Enterococcus faecium]PQG99063.1 hypothetical protein CUS40_05810 [Enterococcus faecium]
MNKQELIDKWENKTGAPSYEISDFSINPSKNDMYIAGYGVARTEIIKDLKQLDEPQKPVMPKFFDVWAKRVIAKHDEFYAISLVARAGWGYGVDFELSENGSSSENKDLLYWIIDKCSDNYPNKKKAIEALLYGYEVEKEPLYEVIIGDLYLIKKFNNRNDFCFDTSCSLCAWEKSAYQLTEAEIKAIDERYWPFAVPVEEVVEG